MLNAAPRPKPKPVKVLKEKKRKKKTERQKLTDSLDRIAREIVLFRDPFCVCPAPANGHTSVMQPGHLITRGRKSVRWDLRGLNCQCSGCNLLHNYHPERYTAWFMVKYGVEEYMKFVEDSDQIADLSLEEMRSLLSELTAIHERQLSDKLFIPRYSQREILTGEWRKKNEGTRRITPECRDDDT